MKKALFLWLSIVVLENHAYAEDKNASPPTPPDVQSLKNGNNGGWSFFFNAFKFKDERAPVVTFEWGVFGYHTARPTWSLTRYEPFIKLRWAILNKYLQPYFLFALDSTSVNYRLSDFRVQSTSISVDASLTSDANPSYGGGLQVFLIGWKKLNFYAYGQFQTTALNDGVLESASLKLGTSELDLYSAMVSHIDINYNIRRYDCGLIGTYKPLDWLTPMFKFGYLWFDVNIKLNIDEELAGTIRALTKINPRDIIPKRFTIDEGSIFALVGLKFKIYKRLHLGLEGTIVPLEHPIYFWQISLLIEGNK